MAIRPLQCLLVLVLLCVPQLGPRSSLSLAPSSAHAEPTKAEIRRAKELFKRAERAAKNEKYEKSAELYLSAFALFPSNDFLFNAAQMFRFAGDNKKAIIFFEKYLIEEPKGRGADKAREALEVLRKGMVDPNAVVTDPDETDPLETNSNNGTESTGTESTGTETTNTDSNNETGSGTETTNTDSNNETGTETDTSSTNNGDGATTLSKPALVPRKDKNRTLRYAGIGATAAGAILVGVGVYFGMEASRISDEVSNSGQFEPDLEKQGAAAERNMFIFAGVGTAAVAGGLALYILHRKPKYEKQRKTQVLLSPTASGFQLQAVGRF